jgi:hypothetical protein
MRNAFFIGKLGKGLCLAFICILSFCLQKAHAQQETYAQKLNGYLKPGDSCVVIDDKFDLLDDKAWGKLKNLKVEGLVSLQLRFDTLAKKPNKPFNAEVQFDVYYWSDRKQEKPTEKKNLSIRVQYDTAKGKPFKSQDIFTVKGAFKMAVVIRKIKSNLFKDSLPPFFQLTNKINIPRKYQFDPTAPMDVFESITDETIGGINLKSTSFRRTNCNWLNQCR